MYLLDTNVCVNLLRANSATVVARLAQVGVTACAISEITEAELRVGAETSQRPVYQHALIDQLIEAFTILSVAPAIRIYARECARLQTTGQLIDNFDLLIGATAIVNGLTMVTNNTRHFQRLPLPALEDWTQAPDIGENPNVA
ncbi:hypothetical protein A0257_13620 [Hymenobacter psoromatis]|nr:hypothetical protein A0257_13620 [Hymenobacter psoromatis]